MKSARNKVGRTGERSRIVGVFQRNESILKRFLRRFTSNPQDIEDICQETVLRALEAEKSRVIQEPRAFLFGIAHNIVRKELERKSRGLIELIEDFSPQEYESNEPPIEDALDARERMILFLEAVATLPSQCQRVFLLKKVYGYSHKDIARKLGISVSTVEKHAASGLKRCSAYIENPLSCTGSKQMLTGVFIKTSSRIE